MAYDNPKIEKLEDLLAWQKARAIFLLTYKLTDDYPKSEEYNLKKHMRECSRNIPGNIAEGFGRYNFQECMQFYRIARGSLSELKSDYYCSFDLGILNQEQFETAREKLEELAKYINGLIRTTFTVKNKSSKK
ncbi:MAG: four helix bundle protein [Candidatus Berkelbacteria bacterium]|nr:four helix bundle protein [Candidatus Berkelbacteria bacterium]